MVRLQLKQIHYVYNTDLKLRELITQNRNSSHRLKCRGISTAGHNDIRLFTVVVACPLPDAYTLCAMLYCLIHRQPLITWMLGCNNCIHIILALDTVIKAG